MKIQVDEAFVREYLRTYQGKIERLEAQLAPLIRKRDEALERLEQIRAGEDVAPMEVIAEDKLSSAAVAYDMDPKPKPGQLVQVTYRAVWGCWDSIKRPITKPILQPDTSRFLAPRDAFVEIIPKEG